MGHENFRLFEGIIALSVASTWELAVQEWDLLDVWFVGKGEEPETCLCGHRPIIEVCVIKNHRNGRTAEVGNVCVNKFMGLPSEGIFEGLRRIQKYPRRGLNPAAADFAHAKGWINDWEALFCANTWRLRKPSPAREVVRMRINRQVLSRLQSSKLRHSQR